jgi:hypothetical protein
MATVRKTSEPDKPRRPPAKTPEGREKQLVSMAVDLAEKQLREGTASAQVISHFLKLGSTREILEQERLANENQLLKVKVEAMASAKQVEELYRRALNAMRSYSGQEALESPDDDLD